jgi:hypothetical protein
VLLRRKSQRLAQWIHLARAGHAVAEARLVVNLARELFRHPPPDQALDINGGINRHRIKLGSAKSFCDF